VFRHALSLFRIYVDSKQQNKELQILDPAKPDRTIQIELPIPITVTARK
jgi:hypothetical protein